ncbi:MAG TPA: hypothetical protein VH681_15100 [Nitrospiraceae bacterium]|jgi:hypothetical protein
MRSGRRIEVGQVAYHLLPSKKQQTFARDRGREDQEARELRRNAPHNMVQ